MLHRIFRYKRIFILVLIPIAIALTAAASLSVGFAEWYALNVYPIFSGGIGYLVSLAPFSVSEILIVLAVLGITFYIVWVIVRLVKNKSRWKNTLWRAFLNFAAAASILYFGFVLSMGINYYRRPVTYYLGLEIKESSAQDLYNVCEILVRDCALYRSRLSETDEGIAKLSDNSWYETSKSARDAYYSLAEQYPVLKAVNIRNKPLLSSRLFSYLLTTGVFMPYTFESNINIDAPAFTVPATMCHELTHFRGFMREQEANFLGYLACMHSDRDDFRYSGSLMAFGYAFNQLYDADIELAAKIAALCPQQMLDDINYEDEYWSRFRHTVAADISGEIYDDYLVSQNQPSGLKSYGEMVDLLIAYYNQISEA